MPRKFNEIVKVDDQPLPEKEIIGQPFAAEMQPRQLGTVSFEIYRPKKKAQEEGLRLTAVEIGEIPITEFFKALSGDLRAAMPGVFLLPDVCGTIHVEFLRPYINQDRYTVDGAVGDDPKTRLLLRLFQSIAPEVQRCCRIRMGSGASTGEDEAVVREVADRLNRLYGPTSEKPPETVRVDDEDSIPWDVVGGRPRRAGPKAKPPLRLVLARKEFELDESFDVTLEIGPDYANQFTPEDVCWYTDRALAQEIKGTENGKSLTPGEVGHGVIRVDVPGTLFHAAAHYDLVVIRRFRITVPHMGGIVVGSEVPIMTTNHDKIRGKIEWSLEGVGSLNPQGKRAIYSAIRPGRATVYAVDSEDPESQTTCDIVVTGQPLDLICVCGEWFTYETVESLDTQQTGEGAPIQMVSGGPHRLFISRRSSGYTAAMQQDLLPIFLMSAIAAAFPPFKRFEVDGEDLTRISPTNLPTILAEIREEGSKIFAEMIKGGLGSTK